MTTNQKLNLPNSMRGDVSELTGMFLGSGGACLNGWAEDVKDDFGYGRGWTIVRELMILASDVLKEEEV